MIRVGREAFFQSFYSLGEAEKMHFRPIGLKMAFFSESGGQINMVEAFLKSNALELSFIVC